MKTLFGGAGVILMLLVVVGLGYGYVMNVVKVFECDFEAPYKAEVIRVVGIPFAPVGIIAGYCDLGR